jgi:hypothetical protein
MTKEGSKEDPSFVGETKPPPPRKKMQLSMSTGSPKQASFLKSKQKKEILKKNISSCNSP